jgi:DNA helicase-2/ATP-dependent DNA helicase PcrA
MGRVTILGDKMNVVWTPAQQAVIAHDHGPALVFAAAGSGKTTTMVGRIARLVQGGIFPAGRILATSFNRAAADSIERALHGRGVKGVHVKTLHALGYGLISHACEHGLLRADLARSHRNFETLDRQLLHRVLAEARRQRGSFVAQLNSLDVDDFLDFLARCKGNLAYADLAGAQLPPTAQGIATQAQAPVDKPWYLALYRLYEDLRRQLGWITYDDMLMVGWETLIRHPKLLRLVQDQYRCVLVDEFQDVNLAQVELIDRISQPHRNLMVIGDDDQTIYEWRGAAAYFILQFQERYGAQVYFLQENFRCSASQVALANAIIVNNTERSAKTLKLTQGFDGSTTLQKHADEKAMGTAIAAEITRLGENPGNVAVLVRLFAQTAPIEAALLEAGIPYVVEGDLPFYRRPEVTALIDYLRLAQLETRLLGGVPLNASQIEQFEQIWPQIANRPLRYLARSFIDLCTEGVVQRGQPLSATLKNVAAQAPKGVASRMNQLAADLHWLAQQVGSAGTAQRLLLDLEHRLGYIQALIAEGGGEELGQAKAAMIHAFVELAGGKESLDSFLAEVDKLDTRRGRRKKQGAVTITTIFRAKGLEWPVVIVPGCNEGLLPYARGSSLAEERRLLYVAVTRAQKRLYLHAVAGRQLSSFLVEAQADVVLSTVERVRRTLTTDPNRWRHPDALTVAVASKRLGLDEYLMHWWTDHRKTQVAARIAALLTQLSAQGKLNALGLTSGDVSLWYSASTGSSRSVGTLAPAPPPQRRVQRAHWTRTRRHSQSLRDSMGRFFISLRELLQKR